MPSSSNDIFMWPDNTWCFAEAASEMSHMSDDYEIIFAGSPEWDEILGNQIEDLKDLVIDLEQASASLSTKH